MVSKLFIKCKGFALAFVVFASQAQSISQVENFRDIAGTPFFPRTYADVNGTPYLFEDWTTATIVLSNGRSLKDIKTNFNLVTDQLLFLDEGGKAMVASPVVIKSVETNTDEHRKFVPTPAKNTFYEVISSQGKATLLRHVKKVIMETKNFNSATIQKNFVSDVDHLIEVNGSITEVKSVSDLCEALGPADQLKEYAKKEKLKQKSVDSWVKIVDYYNSI